ncbi:ABC transporter ATP-binding protein [Halostagnicola sp. A-GB9-2]|uniref:ABC transporter ATP-binding protein n=1 Tax=Halostagnicola sp. A-GB9-2 TaxID=3048066 RepID=UPI0024C0DF85|nr:ABC transporter ATP-binding protein [Halostagnicola sp. A-GB9-2]MDJ1430488.1 ABC transporter ATP-binding protein [Halostagnicola sp. A-GB9-2]
MLETEHLGVSYGKTPILRDVNISIEQGEIVGIMGKNGVGKTTLVKALIGLLDINEGRVTFDDTVVADATANRESFWRAESFPQEVASTLAGTPISNAPGRLGEFFPLAAELTPDATADQRARAGMGYIPQGRDVFPELTVEENLEMGETINGDAGEFQYDAVYEFFPILEERRTQDAGTLSGGQQQMLAIGRALIGNPDLLLLDEPSEGVQPSIVQDLTRDLEQVNEELGTTILFVEQNLHVVQNLAERCYAIDKGTIVDELGPERLASRDAVTKYLAV